MKSDTLPLHERWTNLCSAIGLFLVPRMRAQERLVVTEQVLVGREFITDSSDDPLISPLIIPFNQLAPSDWDRKKAIRLLRNYASFNPAPKLVNQV